MFCENCGAALSPGKKFCGACGKSSEEKVGASAASSARSASLAPPAKGEESKKERLLAELRKELEKAQVKAKAAKAEGRKYHWHLTLNSAIASLQAYTGSIDEPEDLRFVPGFGKCVMSLATTCWHHAKLADPSMSVRPKRHRDLTPPPRRVYSPHWRGYAMAVLIYMRRYVARMLSDFISLDAVHRIAAAPIVLGKKGWSGSPMADLAQRGLVTGNAHAGWTLTSKGEDVANACCERWDNGPEPDQKRRRTDQDEKSDDEQESGGDDVVETSAPVSTRKLRDRSTPSKPQGPISAFAEDFYEVAQDDGGEIVILAATPSRSTTNGASSGLSAATTTTNAAAQAPPSASSASTAVTASPSAPVLSGKDAKD